MDFRAKFLLLLLVMVIAAMQATAGEIAIVGPERVDAGDEVVCRLTGTPAIDLSTPLVEQLGWLSGERRMVAYLARPGQGLGPLDVRAELVFGAQGATLEPLVRFTPEASGVYGAFVVRSTIIPAELRRCAMALAA